MKAKEYKVYGVDSKREVDPNVYSGTDYRTPEEKIYDFLSNPDNLFPIYILFSVAILLGGIFAPVLFLIWWVIHIIVFKDASRQALPLRVPLRHMFLMESFKKIPIVGEKYYEFGIRDYGVPEPGWISYEKSSGLFYLGRERVQYNSSDIYASADDILTHMLIFGTTGSGKTEMLLGLSFNALAIGSGVSFIDPKGTNELSLKVFTISRMFARDDDFLLINYSTGGKKIKKITPERKSNTTNPFSRGTADSLSDLLVSLMPPSSGDGAYFQEGAITLIKSAMYGLVEMRDQRRLNLSVKTIREWITLEKLFELANDKKLSVLAREAIIAYLNSVPGLNLNKPADKQEPQTLIQFGYNQSYFRRPLSSLTDTYGHVYGSLMGEIDFKDVVYNRRILVVLLPATEKSPEELKGLGKIILTAIRNAVALGTGDNFEGSSKNILDTLPISKRKPTLFIVDEYGYVATEGFAVLPAQARGLGAAFVFAGQDFAGFKRGSETEASQIVSNTKIKVFMSLEDPNETWELAQKIAGEAKIYASRMRERTDDGMFYRYGKNVDLDAKLRVDINDLKMQISGDYHLFYRDKIIRGHSLYVPLNVKSGMRINRYCEIDMPEPEELEKRYGSLRNIGLSIKAAIEKKEVINEFLSKFSNIYERENTALLKNASVFRDEEVMEKSLELFKNEGFALFFMFYFYALYHHQFKEQERDEKTRDYNIDASEVNDYEDVLEQESIEASSASEEDEDIIEGETFVADGNIIEEIVSESEHSEELSLEEYEQDKANDAFEQDEDDILISDIKAQIEAIKDVMEAEEVFNEKGDEEDEKIASDQDGETGRINIKQLNTVRGVTETVLENEKDVDDIRKEFKKDIEQLREIRNDGKKIREKTIDAISELNDFSSILEEV